MSSSPECGTRSIRYPASRSASKSTMIEAGVSSPTAFPNLLRLVGYAESTRATLRSSVGTELNEASLAASSATRSTRSGRDLYAVIAAPRRRSSASTVSLNETGTETIRPSNSGIATAIATSTGVSPVLESSQTDPGEVAQIAWMTGTSSMASEPGSQDSVSSSNEPAARVVVITASTPSATRRSIAGVGDPSPTGPGRNEYV